MRHAMLVGLVAVLVGGWAVAQEAPAPAPAPDVPPALSVLVTMARAQDVLMQAELSTTREWRAYQRATEARAAAIKAHDARVAERLAALQAKANGLPEHRAALALKQRADAEAAASGLVIDWTTGQIGAKP